MIMKQSLSKTIPIAFDGAFEKVKQELQNDGFGIIKVDILDNLKKKISLELHPFGVFFPCSVFIQELDTGSTEISVIDPETLVSISNSGLQTFAAELKSLFELALASL